MRKLSLPNFIIITLLLWAIGLSSNLPIYAQSNAISFTTSILKGAYPLKPTSLQFGPDRRLYVSQQDGLILVYGVTRTASNDYKVTATEKIDLVQKIQNHDDDDGEEHNDKVERQVTGLLVVGTATQPVLYVTSSDYRIGAGAGGVDKNLDTNSGIISRLTLVDGAWEKVDIVRGLPRSEENHAANGMVLDPSSNTLYVANGGFTNAGAPSVKFAFSTEYALAAAILTVDLDAINALPTQGSGDSKFIYDLPTLNDPTRDDDENGNDINDPFGGNDGLNQAKIVPGGPVQIYSPGYRNAYDLVLTSAGQLFTIDNGANGGWGGYPEDESANCTNDYPVGEPGSIGDTPDTVNNLDNLHLVEEGFYGGHPAPVRGNPSGAGLYTHDGVVGVWRTSTTDPDNPLPEDWPPVPEADPRQCDFINPGTTDNALAVFPESTNGIAEYTTDNFGGALKGDLVTAGFDGIIWQLDLGDEPITNDGSSTVGKAALASNLRFPLDVVAQAEDQPFAGTLWIAIYVDNNITIMEPTDYGGADPNFCFGTDDPSLDEDEDGYSNADEVDNKTNPCSASDQPADNDGDFVSDLNDDDDDNDGQPDSSDPFAIDSSNGTTLTIPVDYPFFNGIPGTGFWGVGFTGLMTDGATDYQLLYPDHITNVVAGGTAGLVTITNADGDPAGETNTQKFAFQFGVNVDNRTPPFDVRVQASGPFFEQTGMTDQSQGMFIGTGDQDNYVKLVVHANGGAGGLQVVHESDGQIHSQAIYPMDLLTENVVDLFIAVDPAAGTAQPKMRVGSGLVLALGDPLLLDGDLIEAIRATNQAMAVGLIATAGSGLPFTATWEDAEVTHDITKVNQPPTVAPVAEQTIAADSTLSFTVSSSDPDDDVPVLALSDNPDGMTIADNGDGTGLVTWVTTRADIGGHEILIRATDPDGAYAEVVVKVTVFDGNNAPTIQDIDPQTMAPIAEQTIAASATLSFTVAALDPDDDTLLLALSGNPDGMTIADDGDDTWRVTWATTRADIGVHQILITATDPAGASAEVAVKVTVFDGNNAPTIQDSNPQTTAAESTLSFTVAASDPDDDALLLGLSGNPDGMTITDNGNGTWLITWVTTRADIGTHQILITATDPAGATDSITTEVVVVDDNEAPQILIDGAQVVSGQPNTLSVAENDLRTVEIVVSDENEDAVAITIMDFPSYVYFEDNHDGTASLAINPKFTDAGAATIRIISTDEWGASSSVEIALRITDVNHPPVPKVVGTDGESRTAKVVIGETLTYTIAFSDPDNDAITLKLKSATVPDGLSLIDNGDGSGMLKWETSVGDDIAAYQIIVVATDVKGSLVEQTITLTLTNRKIYLPILP